MERSRERVVVGFREPGGGAVCEPCGDATVLAVGFRDDGGERTSAGGGSVGAGTSTRSLSRELTVGSREESRFFRRMEYADVEDEEPDFTWCAVPMRRDAMRCHATRRDATLRDAMR